MDEAKHEALLFFIDHLMQKSGRRTIHDLSCQFGARGFTEEMRNAVGTTQEGLTDFLSLYPSLFIIDGDQVSLKGFGELDGKNALAQASHGRPHHQRDYEREAVDFFVAKLHKFGPELQIKSLLGHRSQAAPEVRLISGRHLKEFVEFLQSQTEHFVVEGDRVRLKNMPEPTGELLVPEVMVDEDGQPLTGVKAKQAAVDYLRSVLDSGDDTPVPLETFYRKFCDRFPHTVRQEVATNPKELLQFLKLNRNIFFIRSNKVSLVKAREDGEEGGENGVESENGSAPTSPRGTMSDLPVGDILFPLTRENLHRVQLVKSLKQAQEVVVAIRDEMDSMEDGGWMVVDFKLITLGGVGAGGMEQEFLSMVVIATREKLVVFDLAHSDSPLLESGLKQLLESPVYLKILHDAKRVATLLVQRYSILMSAVFDTQIAHAVIQQDKNNKPLSELRCCISFLNLQRIYHPQSLMMSDSMTPRKLSQAPSWGQRPITDALTTSVVEECHCLATALYPRIQAQMPEAHRQFFEEKCREALVPHYGNLRGSHHSIQSPLASPLLPPLSPLLGANHKGSLPLVHENGNGNGGLYRPPATRRVQSFTTSRTNALHPSIATQGGMVRPQPLIPGLVGGPGHVMGGGNARKTSAPPMMGAPYRPLGYHHSQQHPLGPGGAVPAGVKSVSPTLVDAQTQTISTGEITVLGVYYDDEADNGGEKGVVVNGKGGGGR